MLEEKEMLVGVFMTSFGCEEGRTMGTYAYVFSDVHSDSFSLSSGISADRPQLVFPIIWL